MAAVPKGFMPNISGFQASEAVSTVALRAPFETASEARPPNPEFVPVRCTRRQCSVPEKTALLAEADECEARGDLGGCLRRRRYARRCFTGGACGLLRTVTGNYAAFWFSTGSCADRSAADYRRTGSSSAAA